MNHFEAGPSICVVPLHALVDSAGDLRTCNKCAFNCEVQPCTHADHLVLSKAFDCAYPPKAHNCGHLNQSHEGQNLTLCGWLVSRRQVGASLKLYVLQDAHGRVQLVIKPSERPSIPTSSLDDIPLQSIVMVQGTVGLRRGSAIRRDEPTGAVKVLGHRVQILNEAGTDLPFAPHDEYNLPNPTVRAEHRYLDLRRPAMAANLHKRSRVSNIALGFDRLMAILCGTPSSWDVIAFPKTAGGVDPMFKSPSPISAETLALYGLAPR